MKLPAGDPRAVLRDHGLCEELDRDEAREHFEGACKSGNLEVVRAYVALGIDLNSHTPISGETPLIRAAEGNQSEVVRVLAAAGADLNGCDSGERTALFIALDSSHAELLRTLLEVGASPDLPARFERYPLAEAIRSGNRDCIDIMMGTKASPNAGGETQHSALQRCLFKRDLDRLRELLARPDADRNLATSIGDTLLHLATQARFRDVVEMLLDAGADPTRTNDFGWTARDIAVALKLEPIAERLEQAGSPLTQADAIAFFAVVGNNEHHAVIAALDAGFPVDTRDWRGRTGFLHAVIEGHREIAELLRARGTDIDAIDGHEHNALSRAESDDLRKWLLEIGVAASYRDSYGELHQPGLDAVLVHDNPELLRTLLDARTNWSDLSDLSPCSRLDQGNFEDRVEVRAETLRKLGAAGANLESNMRYGMTPLLCFVSQAYEPCVRALLDVGVDIDHEDDHFQTALLVSCGDRGDHETQARITAALLAQGADHTKIDWLSRSAWDCADDVGNDACKELLEQLFEQQRIDALAEHGLDPDTDPELLEPAVFETLARRCDLESFRHWVRKSEHALVRGLLRAGFDPNPPAFDRHGLRPGNLVLCTAILADDEQMIDVLLEGGADPNLVETCDLTAIALAAGERKPDLVRRLLAAGANPNVIDIWGHTPMCEAATFGDVEVLELLHRAGALVMPRPAGHLPLLAAVGSGNLAEVQWLLAHGADIDARTNGRVTALHTAIEKHEIEIALVLIAAGADVNVRTSNEDRCTPLELANEIGDEELIEALLAAGANPSVPAANV